MSYSNMILILIKTLWIYSLTLSMLAGEEKNMLNFYHLPWGKYHIRNNNGETPTNLFVVVFFEHM
jgi:hypothetical protein